MIIRAFVRYELILAAYEKELTKQCKEGEIFESLLLSAIYAAVPDTNEDEIAKALEWQTQHLIRESALEAEQIFMAQGEL